MRYAEIIGSGFYNIGLKNWEYTRIDQHFVAAAHHRQLAIEPGDTRAFHVRLYLEHVRAFFEIVYRGDFSQVQDPMFAGRDEKEFWNPDRLKYSRDISLRNDELLPDPKMFTYMPADARYLHGHDHPYDILLEVDKALSILLTEATA